MFTLDEAIEAINERNEFSCNERDFGYVIDYHLTMEGTFIGHSPRHTKILQNLRGTCFNKSGEIIRLPYHKFHNLNENPEYAEANFDFGQPHWIEEKLDGSMVAPIPYGNGTYRLGTRAGVTDVAIKAENFLQTLEPYTRSEYQDLIFHCLKYNRTPIFEYCARDQRIVIDYPDSMLVLTAIRDNKTGEYLDIYPYCYAMDRILKIQDWAAISISINELAKIVRETKAEVEGVVVKFDDGRFVKIKTEDYVLKHRAIDGLKFEKDVLKLILKNELDDVLAIVPSELKARLIVYRDSVLHRIKMCNEELNGLWERHHNIGTRKEFAEMVKLSPYAKFLFAKLDGRDYSIEEYILHHSASQTAVDSIRWMIGPAYNEF